MAVKFEKTSDLRTHLSEAVHRAQDDAFNAALLADLGDRIGAFCDELKADGLGVSVSLCGRDFCIAIFQDAIDPPKDPAPMPEPVVETTAQSPEPEVLSTPEAAAPVVDDPATDTAPAREPKARPTAKSRGRKALFWTPEKTKELVRLKGAGKTAAEIADALGTKTQSVHNQVYKLRNEGQTFSAPIEKPNAPTAVTPERDAAAPTPENRSEWWRAHLDAVNKEMPGSLDLDLRLVGYMAKEMGIGGAAAMLHKDRDVIAKRWAALIDTPFQVEPEELIGELRAALVARHAALAEACANVD